MYAEGLGVQQDREQALIWYERARPLAEKTQRQLDSFNDDVEKQLRKKMPRR